MEDFHNSVMIALLPTTSEWCHIDLPHMTLVYVGEIPNLPQTTHNELAKVALTIAMACHKLILEVLHTDVLGDEDLVDVLLLRLSPELMAMRYMVQSWNASKYPFNPHVTVGPVGSIDIVPVSITFDQIMVCWGENKITHNLL